MKKIYEVPSVSVAKLEELDVILTSTTIGEQNSELNQGEWTEIGD